MSEMPFKRKSSLQRRVQGWVRRSLLNEEKILDLWL